MQIKRIFEDIKNNKPKWVQVRKGSEFEDIFELSCKKNGFTRVLKEDCSEELKEIKNIILDDTDSEITPNNFKDRTDMRGIFIAQPFGSQSYPDFLIFTNRYIVPIEYKGEYYAREFTLLELAQIQSFPKEYQFFGSKNDIITQIGNAVPPVLAKVIRQKIIQIDPYYQEEKI
jgi:hypothetical protein